MFRGGRPEEPLPRWPADAQTSAGPNGTVSWNLVGKSAGQIQTFVQFFHNKRPAELPVNQQKHPKRSISAGEASATVRCSGRRRLKERFQRLLSKNHGCFRRHPNTLIRMIKTHLKNLLDRHKSVCDVRVKLKTQISTNILIADHKEKPAATVLVYGSSRVEAAFKGAATISAFI